MSHWEITNAAQAFLHVIHTSTVSQIYFLTFTCRALVMPQGQDVEESANSFKQGDGYEGINCNTELI